MSPCTQCNNADGTPHLIPNLVYAHSICSILLLAAVPAKRTANMQSVEHEEPLPPGYPSVRSGTCTSASPFLCKEHPTNEDRALVYDDMVSALKLAPTGTRGPLASLFGVFDGHGGDGASKFVSNHLHHLIGQSPFYESIDYPADEALASAVEEGIASVEQAYTDWAKKAGDTSGCCACVVAIRGSVLCAANVGDCQAILITDKGSLVSLSRPHRATDVEEKARIRHKGGRVVQGRVMGVLEPSRVIGDIDIKRSWPGCVIAEPYVLVRSLPYTRGQAASIVVVASDGVWDSLSQTRVSDLVIEAFEKQQNPREVSERLVQAAKEAGSGDDITVVVAKLG